MARAKPNQSAIDVMVIDRTDPHAIVCVTKDGKSLTRLDDIKASGGFVGRNDMALVNMTAADGHLYKQVAIHFTKDGIHWADCRQWFTRAERAELHANWRKQVQAAREYPEMAGYLSEFYSTDEKLKVEA